MEALSDYHEPDDGSAARVRQPARPSGGEGKAPGCKSNGPTATKHPRDPEGAHAGHDAGAPGTRAALRLELPYPPSVNHYYRRVGARTLISREGRAYRRRVCVALKDVVAEPSTGRLRVAVDVHPPDRRRRDLDNAMKALLDALQHGGAYEDDSQIDHLDIRRGAVVTGGMVMVLLTEVAGK